MTATFLRYLFTATAGLIWASACSTQYDVGDNTGTGGVTSTATGGSGGTGMGGSAGGNTGGDIGGYAGEPVETRLIENIPVPCAEWGKGVVLSNQLLDKGHQLESLGERIWGLAPLGEAWTTALSTYGEVLKTSGDAYCITHHMLGDPRAKAGISRFSDSWLALKQPRDPNLFPEEERLRTLNARTVEFATRQILTGSRSIKNLFTGSRPMELSPDWGAATPVNANERFGNGGLLSEPAFIMRSSTDRPDINIDKVGVGILATFICQSLPPPPANVDFTIPPPTQPGTSYRQAYLDKTMTNPACAACHRMMSGLGLAMDSFDALGRIQPADRYNVPYGNIDPADLPTSDGENVSNPVSVANYVSNHERLVPCFATAVANDFLTSWNKPKDPEFAWKEFPDPNAQDGNGVVDLPVKRGEVLSDRLIGKVDAADIIATVVRFMLETRQFPWN
jgi:Protein of unknown function (DUF1588)